MVIKSLKLWLSCTNSLFWHDLGSGKASCLWECAKEMTTASVTSERVAFMVTRFFFDRENERCLLRRGLMRFKGMLRV